MKRSVVCMMIGLMVVAQLAYAALSFPSPAPALLWSPHHSLSPNNGVMDSVNYQTISPEDLAKSVLSEGGWSNLLCSGKNVEKSVDLALVFVGRELRSLDISGNKHADKDLVDSLKVSFTGANFSLAFPYVAASLEEGGAMESSLISGFEETCGHINNVAFLESCSLNREDYTELPDMQSVQDYLVSRMEKRSEAHTDLVVFCHETPNSLNKVDQTSSENTVFSELISYVEQSGAKYTVLYVSDPFKSIQYPSYRDMKRFLAEIPNGNGSANHTICDGVCQIKSSLLEGILVGIVLLVILISGLCCMMGIDTPTRFETPQDS